MKKNNWTFADLETAPDLARCERVFEPLPPFDPKTVAFGNTKDPGKRAELVELRREEHTQKSQDHAVNFIKKAALSPATGRITAIGYRHEFDDEPTRLFSTDPADEKELIERFITDVIDTNFSFTLFNWSGGNGKRNFDANYLFRRALALRIDVATIEKAFTDLAARFMQFEDYNSYLKLTTAAAELNIVVPQVAPVTGEHFWRFLRGEAMAEHGNTVGLTAEEQKEKALLYLDADVNVGWQIAKLMTASN